MTRAPSSVAISAVRSLLESTTRISASGTARRTSQITLPMAFSSLRVIIATVRFSRFNSTPTAGHLLRVGLDAHDDDAEREQGAPQRGAGVLDGVNVLHVKLVAARVDQRPRVGARSLPARQEALQQRQDRAREVRRRGDALDTAAGRLDQQAGRFEG